MFRRWVTDRRGRPAQAADDELFTGEVWTGARALELGLVDGLGTPRGVLAERFPDAELVPVEAAQTAARPARHRRSSGGARQHQPILCWGWPRRPRSARHGRGTVCSS